MQRYSHILAQYNRITIRLLMQACFGMSEKYQKRIANPIPAATLDAALVKPFEIQAST